MKKMKWILSLIVLLGVHAATATAQTLPSVVTFAGATISSGIATVFGYVNTNDSSTTAYFEWGTSNSLDVFSSTTVQHVNPLFCTSASLSGLSPNTTYYFRAVGQNSAGTQRGAIMSFNTSDVHLITFQADMSALIASGFNTSTDSIVVNAGFNGWSSASKMTPSLSDPNIFVYSVPIAAVAGQNIEYKFKAFPDGKFVNNGWDTGNNRVYVFADQDIVLPSVQPLITLQPAVVPNVSTMPAGNITSSTATVNGNVNPNAYSTTAYFEWGTSSTLSTFSTTSAQSLGSGTSMVPVSASLTGLSPNATYYYRAVGQNSAGAQKGLIMSFTTQAPVGSPTVSTFPEAVIATTTATISCGANPNGSPTTAYFEWGTSGTLDVFNTTSVKPLNPVSCTSATLTGLDPNTTYYFRAVAQNSMGTQRGSIMSFRISDARLFTFQVDMSALIAAGFNASTDSVAVVANFTGWSSTERMTPSVLDPNIYVYRVSLAAPVGDIVNYLFKGFPDAAFQSGGWESGQVRSFVFSGNDMVFPAVQPLITLNPGAVPTVTTNPAGNITATSASIDGNVNPNGLSTVGYFEWGTSNTLATSNTTTSQPMGSGTSLSAITASLNGLSPTTTYYFRAVGQNGAGTQKGPIMSFTTQAPVGSPTVFTFPGAVIATTTATISGGAYPNGSPTTEYFEWGTSSTLDVFNTTAVQSLGPTSCISASLVGLGSTTTYYFRAVAQNSVSTQKGPIMSFNMSDSHLITFQADLSALIVAGFNNITDSIVVNAGFNGWNSASKMTPSLPDPNIYVYSVSIAAVAGQNIEYKFKAFPDAKFNSNGWDTGNNRIYVFADQDVVLPAIQPLITLQYSPPHSPVLRLPPYSMSGKYLNQQIMDDIAANGILPDRVYELQRGGLYLANASISTNSTWNLRIRANDSTATQKPVIMLYPTGSGPAPWNPPTNLFQIYGDLELRNLQITGYYEPVDTNRWNMPGSLILVSGGAAGPKIVVDSCIISNTSGSHIRTEGIASVIKVTNSILTDIGYLGRGNFGGGRGIDLRANPCDSLIMVNNTFVNWQDRIVRLYTIGGNSTGVLNYFLFDHNTLVNGVSFHGLFALGSVGSNVIIINNLLMDAFAMGNDTDATRQAEFNPSGELDRFGYSRMTWISSALNETAKWTVANNFYAVSDSGQAFYNQFASAGVTGEGSPLTWHINSRLGTDSVNAFTKIPLTLNRVPMLMTQMMRWYRAPNGGNKTKNTPAAWVYGTSSDPNDFDRKGYVWLRELLSCTYSPSSIAYSGGTGGFPAGDLNWFPSQKSMWPGLILPPSSPPLPIAATGIGNNILESSATLRGTVNPNGLSSTAYFEWGTSSTLSTFSTTTAQSVGSGMIAIPISAGVAGLSSNTTYYYRAVGQSSAGTQRGSILSFTTLPMPQNGSALFDGSTSRIRVADGGAANPNAFRINGTALTVEAWIYPIAYPNPQLGNTIVARTLNTTYADPWSSYRLWVNYSNGNSVPAFSISAGTAGSTVTVHSLEGIPSFQWTHLAGTYDGTFLNIYLNGVLKGQINTSISINSANGVGFYIGRYLTDAFEGAIDEVRLWNFPRSQSDIQASMLTQLIGNEPGLVGYWNMNSFTPSMNPLMMPDQTANQNELPVQGNTPIIAFNPSTPPGTPVFSSAPSSLDFGAIEQGSVSTRSLTITNTGAVPMFGVLQTNSSAAQVAAGSAFYVPGGATLTTSLSLQPMISGSITGHLLARANGGVLTQIPYSIVSVALKQFDGNNISMWTLRDGRFGYNPMTAEAGLEWLKGSGKTAVFESGIWIGATVGGNLRTATAWYWSEFTPGPIIDGVAANPNDTTYRVFKIRAGDNASTNADYASWPAVLGAPVNPDGSPMVIGNQTLFSVYNDLNTTGRHFGTGPLGAEVQQTIFGYDQAGARGNSVLLHFRIINKSSITWNNTYIGLWSDPDLGDAGDDLVGVDTARNLGYVYNGSNVDAKYGTAPPAAGYQMLKGAFFTKPIQSFAYWWNPTVYPRIDPNTASEAYNYLQGKLEDGNPYLDQNGQPTSFVLSGDPVAGGGSIDTSPSDRRMLLSTGPFSLEPGQSKEIIAAIILGKGTDYLNSVTVLRAEADTIKSIYDAGQIFGGALENFATSTLPADSTHMINDLAHSGAQITATGGVGGATVEAATYVGPPPGAQVMTTPSISGVGKYLDVQVEGSLAWPVQVRIYYTQNDLAQAGCVESDLLGVYYWRGLTDQWVLYSNSGPDDQGRGPSTTWVDTTNVTINGVHYEGNVAAAAFHLTPIAVGAKKRTITQRYSEAIQFVQSLPDNAFKKPADTRRRQLSDMLAQSNSKYTSGNLKAAAQYLSQNVLNHLISNGKGEDVWVVDATARATLLRMINDLVDLLQRPQVLGNLMGAGMLSAKVQEIPTEYGLSQNYPNPFNPSTTIRYQIPKGGPVTLRVYNLLGKVVATLVDQSQEAGYYEVHWTPQLASGMYIYRLQSGNFSETKKLLLLK